MPTSAVPGADIGVGVGGVPAASHGEVRRRRDEVAEELEALNALRAENIWLQEELRRIEHDALRVEGEVRRGRAENERLIKELLGPGGGGSRQASPGKHHSDVVIPAVSSGNSAARSSGSGEAFARGQKPEPDLRCEMETLAAELRAEMQSLWADGREVRALAARREMDLRTRLSRSIAEEHAEAQAARRVRDAATRKVAVVRREFEAALRGSGKSEQGAAKAAFGPLTAVDGDADLELRVALYHSEALVERYELEREEDKGTLGGVS